MIQNNPLLSGELLNKRLVCTDRGGFQASYGIKVFLRFLAAKVARFHFGLSYLQPRRLENDSPEQGYCVRKKVKGGATINWLAILTLVYLSSAFVSAKALTANSKSSRECAAETCVRMRAVPCGTTG